MNVLNYLTNMIGIRDILDIAIITVVTYNCLKLLRGTRAEQLA